MKAKHATTYATFETPRAAEQAVSKLREAGFASKAVSCLFAHDPKAVDDLAPRAADADDEGGVEAASVAGAMFGGIFGWLLGLGTFVVPGVGPFVVLGPLAATLAGAGVGGAVGGVGGALLSMGVPSVEVERYAGHVRGGAAVVSVSCDTAEEEAKAADVLTQAGANAVDRSSRVSEAATAKAQAGRNRRARPARKAPRAEPSERPRQELDKDAARGRAEDPLGRAL